MAAHVPMGMERRATISAMMPPGHEDVVGSFVTMKEEVMRRIVVVLSLVVAFVGVTGFSPVGIGTAAQEATPTAAAEELTEEELQGIIDAAVAAAEQTPSLLRVDAQGAPLTTRMHIAIVDRNGALLALHSMEDAWTISIDIAQAKAYTAGGLSSDENALSSRSVGVLTQPGGALWNIGNSNDPGTGDDTVEERGLIEFPGGLPLYKNGVLVGGIGVSGDGVDQDEVVAEAGAAGYEPSPVIRVDCVLGLPGVYSTFAAPCPGV
jgi:uncharacterized protein GlcG (DUF336 family)